VRINSVRGCLELSHSGAEHEEAEEAAGSQCLQVPVSGETGVTRPPLARFVSFPLSVVSLSDSS